MMKLLKRIGSLALAGAMALSLAACGGGGAGGSDGTLTMQIWDTAQRDGMQALADAYHEKNPDVTIEIQVTSWDEYWTKLEAAATSNTLPDVFWMHTNYILQYADNGMLADLTNLYDAESPTFYTDHYSDVSISNASGSDGKMYGVPKDKDTVGLVYNKPQTLRIRTRPGRGTRSWRPRRRSTTRRASTATWRTPTTSWATGTSCIRTAATS